MLRKTWLISPKYCPTFSSWNPMALIYFSFHFITSLTKLLPYCCLSTSSLHPLPTFPSGLFRLSRAVCFCLTVVLLPTGWDNQAEPSYPDNVTPGRKRDLLQKHTLRLPHIPDTPRNQGAHLYKIGSLLHSSGSQDP